MIFLNIKIFKRVSLGVISVAILSLGFYAGVQALVLGRGFDYGYFTNEYDCYGTNVLPAVGSTGLAIPNNINTVSELINLLKTYNTSGNNQKVTGSAFVVDSMLGLNGPGHGRNVSDTDWTELTNRLNDRQSSGRIVWSGNVDNASDNVNSFYQGVDVPGKHCSDNTKDSNPDDDAYFHESKNESGINILDDNGNSVYKILRRCANPVGTLPGIPKPRWSVMTITTVNPSTAILNDEVTWTHKIINIGPNSTDELVNYYYHDSDNNSNLIGTQGVNHPFASGSVPNSTGDQFNSKKTVSSSDVSAGYICRVTIAIPSAWDVPGATKPTRACAKVTSPPSWKITPTTTVNMTTAKPNDTITWTHIVKNTGPDTTRKDVTYYYKDYQDLGNGQGSNHTFASGALINATNQFTSSRTVTSDDVNKTFCRSTIATPPSSSNSGLIESSQKCVTVSPTPPPVSNKCNPITIPVVPRTYSAVPASTANPSGYPVVASVTIPVTVSTTKQTWGPYSSNGTAIATVNHTTGDIYTVTFTETKKHISSYTDHFDKQGAEILDTSPRSFSPNKKYSQGAEIKDKNGKSYIPKIFSQGAEIFDTSPRSFNPKIYKMLYSSTTINYIGPDSWTSSIGPCYDYTLTANIGTSFSARVESGANVFINPLVSVSPYRTYITHSMNSEWRIIKMVVQPNTQLSAVSGGISNSDPCNYFDPGNIADCSTQASNGSTVFSAAGTPSVSTGSTFTAPDSLAGTKICFAFSVRARAGWDTDGIDDRWSNAAFDPVNNCIIIVKKPKIQIWGGDLWSGNFVSASTSTKNVSGSNNTFGSWVEYGIFATGMISGVASGSAFAGLGLSNADSSGCNYSTISFTNAGSSSCSSSTTKGNYQSNRLIPDVASSFPGGASIAANTTISPDSLASGTYTVAGNLTLNPSTLTPGKSVIIKATGTVTINGDQRYSNGPYFSISQLPQLIIVASRIIINNTTTQVDAWLVAANNSKSGRIDTCEVEGRTINDCDNKLTINGPVMTDRLYLYRTAGSGVGASNGDPAEVFNLRSDAYLWAAAHATNISRVQTTYTTELPPRF